MNGRFDLLKSSSDASIRNAMERLNLDNSVAYEVQHLKTFTTEPGTAPPGMSQASELIDQNAPLFVHNYQIVIRQNNGEPILSILDPWMGHQEAEWFPVRIICAPRFKSDSSKAINNNLFMFRIDAHSFSRSEPPVNELHVFQVLSCPAQEIVDQLIYLGANPDYSLVDNRVATMDMFHSRKLASRGNSRKASLSASTSRSTPSVGSGAYARQSNAFSGPGVSEYEYILDLKAEEISTSLIDAEVQLLNYCFDDIEEMLQLMRDRPEKNRRRSSAMGSLAAQKKLQRRGSIIPKECSIDPEFRLLVEDFFQKVKFASILLSRLSDYVKEPKAPELIKKLFNILKEGVDICRIPKSNRASIPSSIIYPRFPKETIKFLQQNLNFDQKDLLLELGANWNTPREHLDDQTVYIPTFRNPFDIDKDAYDPTLFRFNEGDVNHDPERRYIQTAKLSRFAKELMARGADLVKVIMSYRGKSARELTINVGEYLELLDEHKEWYRLRNSEGEEGYCPANMLRKIERINSRLQPRGSIFLHRGEKSQNRKIF